MSYENIKWITGHEPNREDEPTNYHVGFSEVTRIEYSHENYGTYGIGHFNVYKGDHLYATMTHQAVAEIGYKDGESEA